jgi:hypothetical protein
MGIILRSRNGDNLVKHFIVSALIAGAMTALSFISPASAQATRTWVSGVGNDTNSCSRDFPCKTFAVAFAATIAGGEIDCVDAGAFGPLTITKSISILCDNTIGGPLVGQGSNGVIVNAPAGSIVTLAGLDIECIGTGLNGVEIMNAGVVLRVHKVRIRNCVHRRMQESAMGYSSRQT